MQLGIYMPSAFHIPNVCEKHIQTKETAKDIFRRLLSELSGCLEDVLQSQLDIAWLIDRIGDLADPTESRGADCATQSGSNSAVCRAETRWTGSIGWWRKAYHVERVEKISTELKMATFGNGKVL